MHYDLEKDIFWRMDNRLRVDLLSSPAAFKIFVACLFENLSVHDMLGRRKLYESYGLNHHSLRTHANLVNLALDSYVNTKDNNYGER